MTHHQQELTVRQLPGQGDSSLRYAPFRMTRRRGGKNGAKAPQNSSNEYWLIDNRQLISTLYDYSESMENSNLNHNYRNSVECYVIYEYNDH